MVVVTVDEGVVFGLDKYAFSPSKSFENVSSPTIPSITSPAFSWNVFIASWVFLSLMPVVISRKPKSISFSWIYVV